MSGKGAEDARESEELGKEAEEPGEEVDAVASAVLDAAVEVHRVLGPGFLEGVGTSDEWSVDNDRSDGTPCPGSAERT